MKVNDSQVRLNDVTFYLYHVKNLVFNVLIKKNIKKTNIFVTVKGLMLEKMCLYGHFRLGGGPRVVISTAAFHARVRGSVPGLGGSKETKMFLPHPRVKDSIVRSLRDREVACSASDRQGSNFESCVWRTVSS